LEKVVKEKESHFINLEKYTKEKEIRVNELSEIVHQYEEEIQRLSNDINNKDYKIIELSNTISDIEKSVSFKILKKINRNIEKSFPNKTRRGEFKKIVKSSASMIEQKGMSEYLSAVKSKVSRHEFKILEPINLTKTEQDSIINEVKKNKKNRLKIKSNNQHEIENDDFTINDEENLI